MSESDLDHDEGVARIDGNYLALRYIAECRKWRAIAERDHGAPIETVERMRARVDAAEQETAWRIDNETRAAKERAELRALVEQPRAAAPQQPAKGKAPKTPGKRTNTCGKCGAVGFTATTCGRTHNVAPVAPAPPKPARKPTPPGELVPLHEVVSFGRLGPP